ncbi:seminase-like [Drosophila montana]|uniref:seminase-like n=1 Tax=Drosophila montana TaxID=40370 RepID=UPI00313F1B99
MASNTGDNFGGWLVRVRSGGTDTLSCCGSYYSPLLVISSANCINPFRYQLDEANVVSTANAEDEDYNFSRVDTVYFPDDFTALKTNVDISVVRLNSPLKGSMTEFIKLAPVMPSLDDTYLTFGWGFDSLEVQPPSDEPRKTELTFTPLDTCKTKIQTGFVSDTVVCAKMPEDSFECIYDGGSPVVWKNQLVAVASVGFTCRNTSLPGIYTSVIKLTPYIKNIRKAVRSGQLARRKREIRQQWESLKRSPSS